MMETHATAVQDAIIERHCNNDCIQNDLLAKRCKQEQKMTTASNWTVEEIFRHVRAVYWTGLPEPVKDLLFKLEEDHEKLEELYTKIGQVKYHMDDIEPELPLCSDMLDLCENDPVEYSVMRDSHKDAYRKMRKAIAECYDILEGEF